MSIVITVFSFILLLSILVVAHEAGHFLIAKLFGMAVDAFSVGFGPVAWSKKWGETSYQIRWLPLGGFVSFAGDKPEEEAPESSPDRWYANRPRWQRAIVLLGGPMANLLLATGVFACLAMTWGAEIPVERELPPVVGWVEKESPASQAGVALGDRILQIGNEKVENWEEAQILLMLRNRGAYDITLQRGSKNIRVRLVPKIAKTKLGNLGMVGLAPQRPAKIGAMVQDGPAHKAGLVIGDLVVAVDGKPISNWRDLHDPVQNSQGKTLAVEVKHANGEHQVLTITPTRSAEEQPYLIGIQAQMVVVRQLGLGNALAWAIGEIKRNAVMAWHIIHNLIVGQTGASALSGPVGIAYITGRIVSDGNLYRILELLAIFSIQLGLFNLLPIPLLDGGQLTVVACEGMIRRDLPESWRHGIQFFGMILMALLFVIVIVMDVGKLI